MTQNSTFQNSLAKGKSNIYQIKVNNVIDIEIFHNFRATVSQIIFVSKIHCRLKLSPSFLKYLHQFLSTLYFYLLHITNWFILSIFLFLTRSTKMLRRTDKMYKWDFFSSHFWWKFCKQNKDFSHQGSNPKCSIPLQS